VTVPFYESVFIARPDISATQVEALAESLTAIIAENGGSVAKTEYWGLKNLAYRIKKNRKGHYSMLNIDAPPQAIAEYERNMRINEDVMRYMTIRVDALEEGPSIMMQTRHSRDDRGRRSGPRPRHDDGPRPSSDRADDRPARTEATPAEAPAAAPAAGDEP
jgi:small subunit ribosomal protein S6